MLALSHKITIDSDIYRSPDHSRLIALNCCADLAIPVNECKVAMTHPEGLDLDTGKDITVELGYDGNFTQVFTGRIEQVDWQIDAVGITAVSSFRNLVAARFNLSFENPTAMDIASAVAGELDISEGRMEPGLSFASYTLGDNISAYDHLKFLAQQCGFDLYANESDEMIFSRHIPGNVHLFQFGVNILALSFEKAEASIDGVEVFGASPASFGEGPLASSWLTKKEVKGSAGAGSNLVRRIYDPSARSQQNAIQIALSLLDAKESKNVAELRTLGQPDVKIGDIASISKMPAGDQNGQFKVAAVNHRISLKKGFTTTLKLEEL